MKPTRLIIVWAVLLSAFSVNAQAGGIWNALEHGIRPDGTTKNTAAIAEVITAIEEAGGGTLRFPAGRYLTGSIQMVDNLTLHLEAGAVLIYSGDPEDSPIVESRWEGTSVWIRSPLVYANGRENIAITGRGTLDGGGENWWWRAGVDPERREEARPAHEAWDALRERIQNGESLTAEDFAHATQYLRPSLVQPFECRNVLIEGVTLRNSPMWMLHPVYSENIVVRGVSFISDGPNGDGIDIDSCRNVRISDCFFDTGDDCIVLKSGRDADGRRIGRPTEFVTITNCVMYRGHGAVVIGSEMSGDVRDVTASNIVSYGTDRGIRLKTARGRGGVIENLRFDNWVIRDAAREAIQISTAYVDLPPEPFSERTPVIRNIAISQITVENARQVLNIAGLEEQAVENVRIRDLHGRGEVGITVNRAERLELHDVRVETGSAPAIRISLSREIELDNVTGTSGWKEPALSLHNTQDVWLRNSRAIPDTDTFVQLLGAATRGIRINGNDFSRAKQGVAHGPDVPEGRVSVEPGDN